jgi:hypothetical protein
VEVQLSALTGNKLERNGQLHASVSFVHGNNPEYAEVSLEVLGQRNNFSRRESNTDTYISSRLQHSHYAN